MNPTELVNRLSLLSFKKVENARQFSKHDLQIISEALERYKLTGGTIKDALHYVIVKEEKGEAEAEALQSLPTKLPSIFYFLK
jgi:hypothetical protein